MLHFLPLEPSQLIKLPTSAPQIWFQVVLIKLPAHLTTVAPSIRKSTRLFLHRNMPLDIRLIGKCQVWPLLLCGTSYYLGHESLSVKISRVFPDLSAFTFVGPQVHHASQRSLVLSAQCLGLQLTWSLRILASRYPDLQASQISRIYVFWSHFQVCSLYFFLSFQVLKAPGYPK